MTTNRTPRRPAQLMPDQIELIEGGADVAQSSELAHTTASAVVILPNEHLLDEGVRERVQAVIENEGIDALAETWVSSPADSLPGILWRGYLLREWIRRYPGDAASRYAASRQAGVVSSNKLAAIGEPESVKGLWDRVLRGNFDGDFAGVLAESARFTTFIGSLEPEWIGDDQHPLATSVTRRETALLRTAQEFAYAAELASCNKLS